MERTPGRIAAGLRPLTAAVGFVLLLTACSGPKTLMLDDRDYPRRPSNYWIDAWFGGVVMQPHRKIAVIESSARPSNDDDTLWEMLEELRARARRLGADAITIDEDHGLLEKRIKGFTMDERTPFLSWRQGEYPLYFLRATAIIYESSLPGALGNRVGMSLIEQDRAERPPPPAR